MLGEMLPDQTEREIRFLMGHYCHLLDAGEAMAWAALFTPDARWIRRNAAPLALGGSGIAAGEVRGRAALAALAETSVMTNFRQLCRHQITDLLLWRTASADQARGRCRMLITDWRDGPDRHGRDL